MDYIVRGVTKSWTQLSDLHFHFFTSSSPYADSSTEMLSYPWFSLVAQSVKNLPAMQATQVSSLGWEDPLEKRMATHSSILAWRIPAKSSLAGYSPWHHKVRHS